MEFEWDNDKYHQNIAKHGVKFEDAIKVFDGFTVNLVDKRFNYGEVREISIGLIDSCAVVVVVHTDRNGKTRIISTRAAIKSERKMYEKAIRKAFNH